MTRRPSTFFLFAWMLLACTPVQAQDPHLILERTQNLYRSAANFWVEGTISVEIEANGNSRSFMFPVRAAEQLPDKMVVMIGGGATPMTVVSDGEQSWLYDSQRGKYLHRLAPLRIGYDRNDIPDILRGIRTVLKDNRRITRKEDKAVVVDEERRPCYVVEVLKQNAMEYLRGDSTVVELWVDQQSGVVWREKRIDYLSEDPRFNGASAISQTTHFTKASLFEAPSESLFSFTPPRGTQLAQDLERFPGVSANLRGVQAPDLSLKNLADSTESIFGNRGKVVLLNFWATWCGPCRKEMAALDSLQAVVGAEALTVYAINQEEAPEDIQAYLDEGGYEAFRVLQDRFGNASRLYGVQQIPTSYLIDEHGVIQEHFVGARPTRDFVRALVEMGVLSEESARTPGQSLDEE